jgi:hypothetical protein
MSRPVTVPGAHHVRCVTVSGSHSGGHPPILAWIEGGVEALSHRLAGEIREALEKLGLREAEWPHETHPRDFDPKRDDDRWDGKKWDVT